MSKNFDTFLITGFFITVILVFSLMIFNKINPNYIYKTECNCPKGYYKISENTCKLRLKNYLLNRPDTLKINCK